MKNWGGGGGVRSGVFNERVEKGLSCKTTNVLKKVFEILQPISICFRPRYHRNNCIKIDNTHNFIISSINNNCFEVSYVIL